MSNLFIQNAAGEFVPATDDQVTTAALALIDKVIRRGPALQNPRAVKEYLLVRFARRDYEVFGLLLLDNRYSVIEVVELFRGTIDTAIVHTREVVKEVLLKSAAAVILFHNHPSGVAEPSDADRYLTDRLKDALALIDVRVLDHLVIGHDFVESFSERGYL